MKNLKPSNHQAKRRTLRAIHHAERFTAKRDAQKGGE